MRSIMKAATGVLLACGLATATQAKAAAVHFSIVAPLVVYPAPYYYGPPCYAYGRYACARLPIYYRPYYYRPYRAYWGPRWHHWRGRYR